jgi:hypothetical protein
MAFTYGSKAAAQPPRSASNAKVRFGLLAPLLAIGMSLAQPNWPGEARAEQAAQPAGGTMPFARVRAKLDKSIPDAVARKMPVENAAIRIRVMNTLARMLKRHPQAFRLLENEDIAGFFVKSPLRAFEIIRGIADSASQGTDDTKKKSEQVGMALDVLLDDKIAPAFAKYPDIFLTIAQRARGNAWYAFERMEEDDFDSTVVAGVSLYDNVALEIGRPLDNLREDPAGRSGYFHGLTKQEKLGLLCSDPSFFQQSSNALLLRWLRTDAEGLDFQQIIEKYKLADAQATNLAFRIVNNDLAGDFIPAAGRDQGTGAFLAALLGSKRAKSGIYAEGFDPGYFYVLANGAEKVAMRFPWLADTMKRRAAELRGSQSPDAKKIMYGLLYAEYLFTKNSSRDYDLQRFGSSRAVFNPRDYVSGGKVTVVQVFDRDDTATSHWGMSKSWFEAKYGKPKTGRYGELIFEGKNARVVHFMGQTKADNQRFVRKWVAEHGASIITLRADELHLRDNMPFEVFGNSSGRYLFINGTCHGAASDSGYFYANSRTNLSIISYTATGRGQVTNTLVELLLDQGGPTPYSEIMDRGRQKIAAKQGDQFTIRTPTPGQGMLSYVNLKTASAGE